MYCPECGKHNPEDSKFCQHCGAKFDDYKTEAEEMHHKHDLKEDPLTPNKSPYPYVISIKKLIVLSITTFGLYEIYWFYKQWKSLKAERELKVAPWVRALFATLTSYFLFQEVRKAIKSVDKTSSLEAGSLASSFFVLSILYKLPDPYWLLSLLSVLPLIPVQSTINDYWKKKYGERVVRSGFGLWNWVWASVGGIILLLAMYGTFSSSSTSTRVSNNSQTNSTFKPASSSQPTSDYNQDEVASSVVNIFCASTVPGEDASGGSGTIISDDGIILTNSHVIPQDSQNLHVDKQGCLVVLPDPQTGQPKEMYWARPIVIPDISDKYDLAFMSIYSAYYDSDKLDYDGVYPRKFPAFSDTTQCTNSNIKLGESVRIFGYPAISGGYSLTVTDGVVSSFPGNGLIVTSAKISHGNSGGLAVDRDGCMVGVPSMVSSDEDESLGVIYSTDLVNEFSNQVSDYLKNK